MKRIYFLILVTSINLNVIVAQSTETFETETNGATSFTDDGKVFMISGSTFDVNELTGGGWNGSSVDNKFVDNTGETASNDGTSFTIKLDDNGDFLVISLYLFCANTSLNNHSGTLTVTGNKNSGQVYTFTKASGFSNVETFMPNNGYTFIDFATEGSSNYTDDPIDELIISSTGDLEYMALDAFTWNTLVLPVELVDFRGLSYPDYIELSWQTVSELNNEKFEIEQSHDGRIFQKIGELKGNGTTVEKKNYLFKVENPISGISYYRLKQVDFDGQFEYSKIISLNIKEKNREVGEFYPNPSKSGLVNLDYKCQNDDDEIIVSIFDIKGELVLNQIQQVSNGGNNLNFDFSALNTGVYIVKVGDDRNSTYRKLVIKK